MRPLSRRGFLTGLSVTAGGAALAACSTDVRSSTRTADTTADIDPAAVETRLEGAIVPFDGVHQAGIATPAQAHLNLVAFRLGEEVDRAGLARLLRLWTEDARRLCTGEAPLGSLEPEMTTVPANLTVTCGFGPRVFEVAGARDRRPDWLAPLPEFSRDQLDPAWGQSDLVLQFCCDDPTMLSHAVRHMVRSGTDYAGVQWMQQGFLRADGGAPTGSTPRNLFGQLDGTVTARSDREWDEQAWIGEGPDWLVDGTAMVVRRISMNLDSWEMLDRTSREESTGRTLDTGAPLTGGGEFTEADYEARDGFGLPVIDPDSHMARARPAADHPEQRLARRSYNYDLPPVPGSGQLSNSGLVFICFQQDPDKQFTPIQARLDEADRLNEWITHIGSAVYWIPPGTSADGRGRDAWWGAGLLESL
ncbi:Dyp-type peroxidase [Corynebacterium halotolerans]|uniref:Iron-dependent peroxidase, protein n=1 Tax=Corynebacterium halotolerans YIM 70093 = DSM 44683 TaxID=1121362 RepID=M1NMP4_9CORY|nr:Dyp-type peroxidase [Corynebacterium halotolerans]AGF72633.1 iron-dependent peroxidase, protein [Corynebacterium halotolerans YIM 70093 = DSM 44683]